MPAWLERSPSAEVALAPAAPVSRDTLEIGLVNNMPDAALESTERQFLDLLDGAAGDLPVRVRLYTLPHLPRGVAGRRHLRCYHDLDDLLSSRLDGLIVTGAPIANTQIATVTDPDQPLNTLTVQINGATSATVNGVTVSNLAVNAAGQVTADITASCTATAAGFTLRVTDSVGEFSATTLNVAVTANTAPTLSYANQAFPAGTTPSFSPSAGPSDNGAVTNIALQSITPSSGLTLTVNPTTGQVTVTGATIAQTYTVVIRATDNCGATTDATFTATLPCPTIALAPTSLPNASVNTAYNQSLSATPAGGNYTFAVTGGLLPQGLTLNANGSFSGAPTQGGTFNFRVTATGFGGCSAFSDYVLTVNCPSLSITTTGLPGGTLGSAYNQTLAVSPAGTYSFAVTSGALPTGLTLNAATGAITGTPTSVGSFAFTVTAGSGGCSASSSFTIAVACAGISLSPATLPGGQAGVAYSQTITVNPAGSYTFSIVQGNLPAGLTLNPSTGVISGLPTVTGTSTFIVKAKAANGCEVDTRASATHCGACGRACGSDQACRDGVCVYTVPASCGAILRATPSSTRSGVRAVSTATVKAPSSATSKPSFARVRSSYSPAASSWPPTETTSPRRSYAPSARRRFTAGTSLPRRGPTARKFGTSSTSTSSCSATRRTSFTFSSAAISPWRSSTARRAVPSAHTTSAAWSGWRSFS